MRKHVPSLMCRLCGEFEETIVHLIAACPSLAASEYLFRHNLVAGVHPMRVQCIWPCGGLWFLADAQASSCG